MEKKIIAPNKGIVSPTGKKIGSTTKEPKQDPFKVGSYITAKNMAILAELEPEKQILSVLMQIEQMAKVGYVELELPHNVHDDVKKELQSRGFVVKNVDICIHTTSGNTNGRLPKTLIRWATS